MLWICFIGLHRCAPPSRRDLPPNAGSYPNAHNLHRMWWGLRLLQRCVLLLVFSSVKAYHAAQ